MRELKTKFGAKHCLDGCVRQLGMEKIGSVPVETAQQTMRPRLLVIPKRHKHGPKAALSMQQSGHEELSVDTQLG